MRRLTALVAVLAIATLTAYAGPYFVIENEGLDLHPSLDVGWDFDAPYVDFSNLSISGDFYFHDSNVLDTTTNWIFGTDLGFTFANSQGHNYIELVFGADVELDMADELLGPAGLETWSTSIGVFGYPGDVVTIYGTVECEYARGEMKWEFTPTIGLECRWP